MDRSKTSKGYARRTGLACGALALAALSAPPSANAGADILCQQRAQPVASVLVIHGGAWQSGSAADVRELCRSLADLGYRARALEYPLWTVPGSYAYAHSAAREEAGWGRPVYALGISAGGTMAEYLAARSEIDGAVAIAPLSDFVNWRPLTSGYWGKLGMTAEMRHRLSPINNIGRPSPMRLIHSPQDQTVPYEQSLRMVSRCGPVCELVTLRLGLGHTSFGARKPALEWFEHAVRHPRRAAPRPAPPPLISAVGLRPRSFVVRRGARGGRRGRAGTILSYTLAAPARVSFTIEREPGSRRVATLLLQGAAGTNRLRFDGRIGRRALAPGSYRATVAVLSAAGFPLQAQRVGFRVRAPRH